MKKLKIMALLFGFVVSILGQSANLDLEVARQNLDKFPKPPVLVATEENDDFSNLELVEVQKGIKESISWNFQHSLILPDGCYINKKFGIIDWHKAQDLDNLNGVRYAVVYSNLSKKDGKFSGTITLWYQHPIENLSWNTIASFSVQENSLQELAANLSKKIKGTRDEEIENLKKQIGTLEKENESLDLIIKKLQEKIDATIEATKWVDIDLKDQQDFDQTAEYRFQSVNPGCRDKVNKDELGYCYATCVSSSVIFYDYSTANHYLGAIFSNNKEIASLTKEGECDKVVLKHAADIVRIQKRGGKVK